MNIRAICLALLVLLFAAPAAGEKSDLETVLDFAGWLIEEVNRPDPYFWIYDCPETASLEDISSCAKTLRDLGLEEVTSEEVEADCHAWMVEMQGFMAQSGFDYSFSREQITLSLLYAAGSMPLGEATRRSVYAFDVEVFDVDSMYRDFLKGIESISGGELVFDRITEDLSGVDWETGDGTRTVTFDLGAQTHTFTARANTDWFDMNMLNDLGDVIGVGESGKRLYFVLDGGQGCILFYQTPEWAEAFTKATNCPLFTHL